MLVGGCRNRRVCLEETVCILASFYVYRQDGRAVGSRGLRSSSYKIGLGEVEPDRLFARRKWNASKLDIRVLKRSVSRLQLGSRSEVTSRGVLTTRVGS